MLTRKQLLSKTKNNNVRENLVNQPITEPFIQISFHCDNEDDAETPGTPV